MPLLKRNDKDKNQAKLPLLLVGSLPVMSNSIIAAGLPKLAAEFSDFSNADLLAKLMLTLPALLVAICAPFVGTISDRWGPRKVMLNSLLLFALSGTSGLFLSDPYLLLSGRALLGISIAGIMTVSMTLAGDLFEGEDRQSFIGMQSAFMAFSGLVFITLGGWLADWNWRFPFALYVIGFLFWLMTRPILPENQRDEMGSGQTVPDTVSNPVFLITLVFLVMFLGMSAFYTVPAHLSFFLKNQINSNATESGIIMGFATFCAALSGFTFSKLRKYFSFLSILGPSFLLVAVGFMLLSKTDSLSYALISVLPIGLGYGLLVPNCSLIIIELSPEILRGRYLGGLTGAIFMGQFASPFIIHWFPIEINIYLGLSYFLYALVFCVISLKLSMSLIKIDLSPLS